MTLNTAVSHCSNYLYYLSLAIRKTKHRNEMTPTTFPLLATLATELQLQVWESVEIPASLIAIIFPMK